MNVDKPLQNKTHHIIKTQTFHRTPGVQKPKETISKNLTTCYKLTDFNKQLQLTLTLTTT
ncbi:hypothetical protein HanXRQr2_Chr01g0039531 [Helianthus annuus]|uniref:Uncharacterized protein n=1 Tax=Helianthus annuus TaxID=4232 RepID=A0A9K3JYD5_HELAN|nr:hypothetical protein HanXRQr2_Chr01g0039531 [Helianthus annuus]